MISRRSRLDCKVGVLEVNIPQVRLRRVRLAIFAVWAVFRGCHEAFDYLSFEDKRMMAII
jgi:hypothetical protein